MKDQHRATDSEWYCLEARTCGDKADVVAYSCILELRDRIKALEASQPEHLIDPEREKAAQELAQSAGFTPRWPAVAFAPRSHVFEGCAASIEAPESATTAQPNHPEILDTPLVDRVSFAICPDGQGTGFRTEARAAIRAVAAWLRGQEGYGHGWAIRLEQEAER